MTKRSKLHLALAAAGLALTLGSAAVAPVMAQGRSADSLRASGQVGEQADGFMACIAACDAETRAAVNAINARRAEAYRDVAGRTGVTEAAAAQAAAQKVIAGLAPGQYYKPQGGGWTRK